jgi:hypothetical protein
MTTQLSDRYPKIIRDFFLFDRSESTGVAHRPITLPFKYDIRRLLAEAERLPYDTRTVNRCYVYGPEGDRDPGCDLLINRDVKWSPKIDLKGFPELSAFIRDCPALTYMTFKRMVPGGYIMPHVDSECNPYKIYVPLSWPAGSRFKVLDQGEVDFTDLKPNLIATSKYMHAVVNDSDQQRIIFSFYVDWSHPTWCEILTASLVN